MHSFSCPLMFATKLQSAHAFTMNELVFHAVFFSFVALCFCFGMMVGLVAVVVVVAAAATASIADLFLFVRSLGSFVFILFCVC